MKPFITNIVCLLQVFFLSANYFFSVTMPLCIQLIHRVSRSSPFPVHTTLLQFVYFTPKCNNHVIAEITQSVTLVCAGGVMTHANATPRRRIGESDGAGVRAAREKQRVGAYPLLKPEWMNVLIASYWRFVTRRPTRERSKRFYVCNGIASVINSHRFYSS